MQPHLTKWRNKMGTRSTTKVYDGEQFLVALYRQFDGYPSGHGKEIAAFLDGRLIVNGFNSKTPKKASNGAGCLAASLVETLKDGIGGIYITTEKDTEEFDYEIHITDNREVTVKVTNGDDVIYEGDVKGFVRYCNATVEEVVGAKGVYYEVITYADGEMVCNCKGFTTRKKCKHVDEVMASRVK